MKQTASAGKLITNKHELEITVGGQTLCQLINWYGEVIRKTNRPIHMAAFNIEDLAFLKNQAKICIFFDVYCLKGLHQNVPHDCRLHAIA